MLLLFLKKVILYTFIQQGFVKLNIIFITLQKNTVTNKCCLFYSLKNPEKKFTVYTKMLSSSTVFSIDDNRKCFLRNLALMNPLNYCYSAVYYKTTLFSIPNIFVVLMCHCLLNQSKFELGFQ